MKVTLFVTCLADTFYPRQAIAVVKVLEHLGCTVEFPQAQTCCGQPMFNTGYRDGARDAARHMIQVFQHADTIVTPSGSCAAMVRDYYRELFEHDHAYEHLARRMAERTYEFVEFLMNVLRVNPATMGVKWSGKVTYHFSCHLRGLGMPGGGEPVMQFMRQIEGLELVPLDKAEQCCGFGGTFAVKYPQMSGAMVRDKVACIKATGAPVVVSNDSGCTMNIHGACRREHHDVQFISLAEILAEGLGLLDKTNADALTVP